VNCGKTADSIEMPFGMVGRVNARNRALGGIHIPHSNVQIFWGKSAAQCNVYGECGFGDAASSQIGIFMFILLLPVNKSVWIIRALKFIF